METTLQSELNKQVKLGEIEVFTAEQIKSFVEESNAEIQKSTGNKDVEFKQVADEVKSFTPIIVYADDTLEKSIRFFRRAQIRWDEPTDDISKARSGTYMNTPENRKAGRVGQKYGGERKIVTGAGKLGESKVDLVVKYLLDNGMTTTDSELDDAAEMSNITILSPTEKDQIRTAFDKYSVPERKAQKGTLESKVPDKAREQLKAAGWSEERIAAAEKGVEEKHPGAEGELKRIDDKKLTKKMISDVMSGLQDDYSAAFPTGAQVIKQIEKEHGVTLTDEQKRQVREHRDDIKFELTDEDAR